MAFSLLYGDAQGGSSLVNLLSYIDAYTMNLGILDVEINLNICEQILHYTDKDFPTQPYKHGVVNASPFKRISYFGCFFISEKTIPKPFPQEIIGKDLSQIPNHQNSIVLYALAVDSLHGATLHRLDGQTKELTNRIEISAHSYCDIIDAISGATNLTHFKMISVLFEQLAYRANPDASYQAVI